MRKSFGRIDRWASGLLVVASIVVVSPGVVPAATPPPFHARHAAVASDNAEASQAGLSMLKAGGNAVDAACATALALGVVHPFASGIGGGGFALVYIAKQHRTYAFDFRERAPADIRADMFLKDGKADPRLSREGGLAVGVPGEVRGLGELVRRFGKLPFGRCVAPAERLTRQAHVSWRLAEVAADKPQTPGATAARDPIVTQIFGKQTLAAGEVFRRPELGRTLARLRTGGPGVFYKGPIADAIVAAVKQAGGVMTAADLESYTVTERMPIEVMYRGLRVMAMPPPSSGGAAVAETLGVLAARYPDGAALAKLGAGSSAYFQVLAEALKHAFADRARHLGDPDFVTVPLDHLLAPAYHAELAKRIKDGGVLPADKYGTPSAPADQHRDHGTTHLSVVDAEGNAVALTTTVNLGFGAHLVAGDTGIVLNDQMDDFAMQPGVPNGFGLIGSAQNAVAPRKRPLSSMTPLIALDDKGVKLVAGAAGGPTIITATLQAFLNVVDFDMDAQAAIAAPRIHDQWFPEVLMVEPQIPRDVTEALAARGQKVKEIPHVGVSNLIVRTNEGLDAAAEPRSPSTPAGY